jgi:hypothetical protein
MNVSFSIAGMKLTGEAEEFGEKPVSLPLSSP